MKFTYWSREIAGWGLILAGLWQFWNTYVMLTNKRIFEAAPSAFIAFIVFRGGVHLLKVAVAAQVARSLPESAQPQTRRTHRIATRSYAPTSVKAVMPGPKVARAAVDNGRTD
ncbi:MAG: hypothetical protein L0241_25035 [Planctomycetia bacterium]|nr:hypothetical protein [Planctomycetia bacterium]